MNKLQRLLVLTVCVTGFSGVPVMGSIASAQAEQTIEMSSEQALDRAEQLIQQIDALSQQGLYAEAIPFAQELLAIVEEILGSDAPEVAIGLNNLAGLYQAQGNYAAALPLYERALSIHEAALGPNHPDVATSLNNLAVLYDVQGNYAAALPLYERALSIHEAALGPNHPDVATSLNNLAGLYQVQGNYEAALPLFERALSIHETALGPDHPDVANSLNNLAVLYQVQGNYAAALPLFERALSINKAALGPDHPQVATSLNNLAGLYRAQGNYEAALSLHERALSIREAALGPDHPDMATSLNNLAVLYRAQGNYAAALPLFERALSIRETALGPNHPTVAANLNNLAGLYRAQGNYAAALPLFERALSIRETALGPNHPDVAASLNNLALLYRDQGNYEAALPLFERAFSILATVLGPDHPQVAISLNNLALLYRDQGNYEAALPLFERAFSILATALGPDHPDVAASLNNLAGLYQDQGNYAAALPLHERALSIRETALGPDHPSVATSLTNLAGLHQNQGELELALSLLSRASEIEEQNLGDILVSASEVRRQRYINTLASSTAISISFNINTTSTNPESAKLALTNILRRKGRVLEATTTTAQQLQQQLTPANQALLTERNAARTQLSNLRFSGLGNRAPAQYQTELSQLETTVESLEEQLARNSTAFRVASEPVTTETVQAFIPTNAALVEFIRYYPYDYDNPQSPWDIPHYAAYLLTHSGQIQVVDLGKTTAIDQSVAEFAQALQTQSNNVKTIGRQLNQQLMAPIRELVGDKSHLLISPDSTLNLIPFEALVDEQNRYLIETYQISYLTSGRDLLKQQLNTSHQQGPVVIANPDYTTAAASIQIASDPAVNASNSSATSSNQRSVDASTLTNFFPLPGTKTEAEAITPLLPNATLFTEQQATENTLKQVTAPSILHIATHGFFLTNVEFITPTDLNDRSGPFLAPVSTDEAPPPITPSNLENPLLRSGLALAGANTRISHGEDGIFTALEAAGLNLYGTQLVVLSACETGVGAASNGEGVYGLRRAFTIAGAESQLMSLWQVDDEGTSTLMQLYYKKLMQQGQGRSEALRNAQLDLLNTGTYNHPYYWSSFIFSGDWRPLNKRANIHSLNQTTPHQHFTQAATARFLPLL